MKKDISKISGREAASKKKMNGRPMIAHDVERYRQYLHIYISSFYYRRKSNSRNRLTLRIRICDSRFDAGKR